MIFLIHGTKAARKRLGYVADFCPVCQSLSRFVLSAVGTGDHVFFVSLGLLHTTGHLRACLTCSVEVDSNITDYGVVARRPDHLEHLITLTHPEVKTRRAVELAAASRVTRSPQSLTPAERDAYLFNVLQLFNPMVERRYSRRFNFDRHSYGGCVVTLALVVFLFQRSCTAGEGGQTWFLGALWALLAGFLGTLVIAARGPGRYLKSEIAPGVSHGMGVIHAHTGEMNAALNRARSLGLKIGRTLKPATLDVPGAPHHMR